MSQTNFGPETGDKGIAGISLTIVLVACIILWWQLVENHPSNNPFAK
jgi:hypothetical protein